MDSSHLLDACSSSSAERVDSPEVSNSLISDSTNAKTEEEEALVSDDLDKDARKKIMKLLREKEDEELRTAKYKGLQSILQKSQFYTQVALKKLNGASVGTTKGKKKRALDSLYSENSAEIINFANKKRKLKMGEALSSNNDENIQDSVIPEETSKKVRVTSLGIEVPANQPTLLIGAALRDYQLEGLDWLKKLFVGGLNGILADEMGLGKTIQTIALLCHLYEEGVGGPFMIVAPLSTLPNWAMEFEKFAPDIPVVTYQGSLQERRKLQNDVRKLYNVLGNKSLPVVLLAYHTAYSDEQFLKKLFWKYIIIDEGHRVKNFKSRLHKTLSSMRSVNKVLLTGTPLQNNLTELWSLLNFLVPEIFTSLEAFNSWFEVGDIEQTMCSIIEKEQHDHVLSLLHQILGPFLLRRVKANVNLYLPPKKEVYIYCHLTETQYELYRKTLDHSLIYTKFKEEPLIIPDNPDGSKAKRGESRQPAPRPDRCVVIDGDSYSLNIKMQNPTMMLRKIANHPYLVQCPVLPGTTWMRVDERMVSVSGKLTILDTLLAKLKAQGHKVILFSTFKLVLDIVEELLEMRDHSYVRLDGDYTLETRKENINKFNTDPSVYVFLVSTRAGGLGLNVTAADTVIIFDSDWNPQVDLQAQDRCHRIGQTKPVIVYRLVSIGTIDERIINWGHAKRKLEKVVIHAGNFGQGTIIGKKPNDINLMDLKKLMEEKTHSGEIRCHECLSPDEWRQLLDRNFS